jgi:hypothetical protein
VIVELPNDTDIPTAWEWMSWACGQVASEPLQVDASSIQGIGPEKQARLAKFKLHAVRLPSTEAALLITNLETVPMPENIFVCYKDAVPFLARVLLHGRVLPKTLDVEAYMASPLNGYTDFFKVEQMGAAPPVLYNAFGQTTSTEALRLTVDLDREQTLWSRCLAANGCTLRALCTAGANVHPEYPHLFLASEAVLQLHDLKQAKRSAESGAEQQGELQRWVQSAPLPPLAVQLLSEGLQAARLSPAQVKELLSTNDAWATLSQLRLDAPAHLKAKRRVNTSTHKPAAKTISNQVAQGGAAR